MDGFNNRLHTDEEKIHELEDIAIKNKMKNGVGSRKKTTLRTSAVGKLHTAQSTCN